MSKILLVDDSELARHKMNQLLSADSTMEVEFAVDGLDALEKFPAVKPKVVVTDMVMPRLDGLTLVQELRRKSPGLPVILVTSEGSEDIAAKALRSSSSPFGT